MTFEVILNLHLHNVDILEKFLKDRALNKKYIAEKYFFGILRLPYVTSEVILY